MARPADAKLRDIAQSLDIMVSELHLLADRNFEGGGLHLAPVATSTVERAMQAYRDRRRREQVFGDASLFGNRRGTSCWTCSWRRRRKSALR
jgi:hypothetical protein